MQTESSERECYHGAPGHAPHTWTVRGVGTFQCPGEPFLLVAEPPAPARPAERPAQLALLPAADSTVAATGLLF